MMGGKYHISVRMGCSRRTLDAARIDLYFRKNGFSPSKAEKADYLIVYTCGGMKGFERDSIRTIKTLLNTKKKGAQLIVTGCLLKINPESLDDQWEARFIPYELLNRLDTSIKATFPYSKVNGAQVPGSLHDLETSYLERFRNNYSFSLNFCRHSLTYASQSVRIFGKSLNEHLFGRMYKLEISRGCMGHCTYCGIKLAMGDLRSRPKQQIVNEFRIALEKGYRRFSIVAGDAGCYGVDIGETFPSLLGDLLKEEGDYRIAINDLHPKWLVLYQDPLIALLKHHHRKVRTLLVPIQSGSDRVLGRMGRDYKIADVKKALKRLRKEIPDLKLETHILVGFPGETEEDFRRSKALVRTIHFHMVDTYQYDPRPRTRAASLPGQVRKEIISRRTKELCSLI